MITRRSYLVAAAAALLLAPGIAHAQEIRLTAPEITALLTGNTIVGDWDGAPYKSYFAPDGMTIYLPEGGSPEQGKWRVNQANDEYQSWWEHTGWTSYSIVRTADGLAWAYGNARQKFTVQNGRTIK